MNIPIFSLINLLGGLAVFLYGVEETTAAFGASFGTKSKDLLVKFTRKKFQAFIFGVLLAAVAQGSTVATSFAIGFVDVGMLSFAGSLIVMMGASVGGAFVTFIISLDIAAWSPLIFAASLLMVRFGRRTVYRAGAVLQGISLILLGMYILKLGIGPLVSDPRFAALAEGAEKNLFLLGMGAFVATAVLQSAPTVLALTVTLAVSGVLTEAAILPIVLGAHAGSSVTVLIAGLSGRQNARKLGISTFVYKVIGSLAIIPFFPWLQEFIAGAGGRAASKIVLVQVGITLVNALMFYFLVEQLAWLSSLLSDKMGKERLSAPVYLDDEVLEIPSLSILLLSKEMIRLANFIEMYCQILLGTGQEIRSFPELPGAIRDLSEICEEYMYGIHIPADDDLLRESYSTVSYSMVSFRQMAKILTGELRLLAEAGVAEQLAKEVGDEMWEELSRTALTHIRISLRAFALADADFAGFAGRYEREYEQLDRRIRLRLGADALNRRELAPLLDFLTQMFLLVKTSLDVARREGYSESSIV